MSATDCVGLDEGRVAEGAADVVEAAGTLLRPHFYRREAHQHASDYLRGLLAAVERKNGWSA